MKLLALDLEMDQPSGNIIQIGAVIGDTKTGNILERFSEYICQDAPVNPEITLLTGITSEMVWSGSPLILAYSRLVDLCKKHQVFRNPLTWGGGDSIKLLKQLNENVIDKYDTENWLFGRRWIDVKTIWVSYAVANNLSVQGGLARICKKVNMDFKGRKHNACDDAENTFILYHHFLNRFFKKIVIE